VIPTKLATPPPHSKMKDRDLTLSSIAPVFSTPGTSAGSGAVRNLPRVSGIAWQSGRFQSVTLPLNRRTVLPGFATTLLLDPLAAANHHCLDELFIILQRSSGLVENIADKESSARALSPQISHLWIATAYVC
jgi:hypothetical protein